MRINNCDRCGGIGYIPKFHYIEEGICFKCGGKPDLNTTRKRAFQETLKSFNNPNSLSYGSFSALGNKIDELYGELGSKESILAAIVHDFSEIN